MTRVECLEMNDKVLEHHIYRFVFACAISNMEIM